MTIGPEPIRRILWMSSRRGTELSYEAVEQVKRVVGPRTPLGVVLDGGARHVPELEAFDRPVVKVYVGELGRAELCLPAHRLVGLDRPRAVRAEHGEAVVLARDLD